MMLALHVDVGKTSNRKDAGRRKLLNRHGPGSWRVTVYDSGLTPQAVRSRVLGLSRDTVVGGCHG